ncbi:hypothetical protein sscle_05g044350 [Sclerotinia sclerotiorum 1980 UF-70]|uniref:3'-5' exoribonuclease Rv2179c-like domain-containing protein n=1 Tax=Sclerotinia sclerotiorum (strain ATCC 18683 / 1980 / Ss-1) TaxID=665079 RepID=A0A1D9Q3Z7_SCLS1|nr:hypothetical protein sscle_05g044350 [Sclerotinia sclerotiorum 1980 UF-70]
MLIKRLNTNIMLDLELAGFPDNYNPAITQIGAIHFDIETGRELASFCEFPQLQSSLNFGPAQDTITITWCKIHNPEALKKSQESTVTLDNALKAFTAWVDSYRESTRREAQASCVRDLMGEVKIWANGSMQDNRWIDTAYTICNLAKPWKYYSNMCIMTTNNTVLELTGRNYRMEAEQDRKGAHDAVADCMHQIGWFMPCLTALRDNSRKRRIDDQNETYRRNQRRMLTRQ